MTDISPSIPSPSVMTDIRNGLTIQNRRPKTLETFIYQSTKFGNETGSLPLGKFLPTDALEFIKEESRLLVVGAGGLGCEMLKDLIYFGFRHIDIIDMDTIELANLNRQFLFRTKDIGKSKAEITAKYMQRQCPDATIRSHFCRIEDKDMEFYASFHLILSGLDNIQARRWLNSMLFSLIEYDEKTNQVIPTSIIPLIDGGSEGLNGQARVIIPTITACFECTLDTFPKTVTYPICTIAETPRQPAHCIIYASMILWPKEFPNQILNVDSMKDVEWVYKTAKQRADFFGIQGVTLAKTLGILKNIIPAVASTNALIAGLCVMEAFKLLSYASQTLDNYHMHMGTEGIYSYTYQAQKKTDCPVCSSQPVKKIRVHKEMTLDEFIQNHLSNEPYRLNKPSIRADKAVLLMQGPLYEQTKTNLKKRMDELLDEDTILTITDPVFATEEALSIRIEFV